MLNQTKFLLTIYLFAIFFQGFLATSGQRAVQAIVDSPLNAANFSNTLVLIVVGLSLLFYSLNSSHFLRGLNCFMSLRTIRVFSLVFLIAILSAFYSSIPLGTVYKASPWLLSLGLGASLTVYILKGRGAPLDRFMEVWHISVLLIFGFVLLMYISILFPTGAPGYRIIQGAILPIQITGSWYQIHTNTSSFLGIILICHGISNKNFPSLNLSFIIVGIFTLLLAQSRTALIMTSSIFFIYFIVSKGPIKIIGLLMILMAIFLSGNTLIQFLLRGQSITHFFTLTGRTVMWEKGMEMIKESLFFGYGFYSGVRYDMSLYFETYYNYKQFGLTNLDNTYMNLLLEIGLLGVIPFIFAIILLTKQVLKRVILNKFNGIHFEMFALLTILLIKSMTGVIVMYFSITQFLLIILTIYTLLPKNKNQLLINNAYSLPT